MIRYFIKQKPALELFDAFIERKRYQGKSVGTITSIKASRKHLASYLNTLPIDGITAEWWEMTYIRNERRRKLFNDRKWLVGFLKQMQEDGRLDKMPKLINPDPKSSVGKVFTDEQVGDLLNFAQNEDLYLGILMAATMGMRRLEIFHLRVNRVDLAKNLIRLRVEDTKIRKARSFAISPVTLPFLIDRCHTGSEWIFPSKEIPGRPLHKDGFYTAWNNLKETCGVTGRFHDLRHTFLTKAFNTSGAVPAQICAYAGLSLEEAERTYLHLTEEHSRKVGELVFYE